MRRLCERPGCGAPAEVAYGIDHASLVVWVDNRAIFERELAGRLCRRHAEALVVPRGWTLDDRREPVPKLFVTKDHPAPSEPRVARRGTSRRVDAPAADQELPWNDASVAAGNVDIRNVDEPADDTTVAEPAARETTEVVDPDETRAVPWSPRLVPSEPDDPSGPVFGRLLGRAFGSRGRDDSVAGEG